MFSQNYTLTYNSSQTVLRCFRDNRRSRQAAGRLLGLKIGNSYHERYSSSCEHDCCRQFAAGWRTTGSCYCSARYKVSCGTVQGSCRCKCVQSLVPEYVLERVGWSVESFGGITVLGRSVSGLWTNAGPMALAVQRNRAVKQL